jgi:hypothetical protein
LRKPGRRAPDARRITRSICAGFVGGRLAQAALAVAANVIFQAPMRDVEGVM